MGQLGTDISLGVNSIAVITGSGLGAIRLAGSIVVALIVSEAMLAVNRDIHGSSRQIVSLACSTVYILVPLPVATCCSGVLLEHLIRCKGYGDFRVIYGQRIRSEGNILGNILTAAVCIVSDHLHTGAVKGLTNAVVFLLRLLYDRQRGHPAAQTHHTGRVVLKVQIALGIADRAADRILCFVTIRCK